MMRIVSTYCQGNKGRRLVQGEKTGKIANSTVHQLVDPKGNGNGHEEQ
jgi:hypothetical protein